MKQQLLRAAAAAVCLSLCAASLSGCMAPLGIGNGVREIVEDNIRDLGVNGIVGSVTDAMPTIEEMLHSEDNPDDCREITTLEDDGQETLLLTARSSSQLIVLQGGDAFQFEYDPEWFSVEPVSGEGALSLTVTMQKEAHTKGGPNYKCILTLPDRAFDKIQVESDHSGIAFAGLSSPLTIQGTASGFAFANPQNDVELQDKNGAFGMDVSKDYAHRFTYNGSDCAFSLRFLGGEPEGLHFKADLGEDSMLVRPSEWGGTLGSFDYQAGDQALFNFTLKNSVGSITIES